MDGIDMSFKLATLDELDDVSNLDQCTRVCLIPQGFSVIVIFGCQPNYMYCDLIGSFLQSFSVHVILDMGSIDYALRIL